MFSSAMPGHIELDTAFHVTIRAQVFLLGSEHSIGDEGSSWRLVFVYPMELSFAERTLVGVDMTQVERAMEKLKPESFSTRPLNMIELRKPDLGVQERIGRGSIDLYCQDFARTQRNRRNQSCLKSYCLSRRTAVGPRKGSCRSGNSICWLPCLKFWCRRTGRICDHLLCSFPIYHRNFARFGL